MMNLTYWTFIVGITVVMLEIGIEMQNPIMLLAVYAALIGFQYMFSEEIE